MQALIVSPKFILSPCLSGKKKKKAPFNKEETRSISSTIHPHEDSSTLDAAGANIFIFLYQMRQLLKALQDLSSDIIQFTTNDNPALEASPCQNA